MRQRNGKHLLVAAFSAFACLGILDAALGVAWPAISDAFRVPIGNLGHLIVATMCGYLLSSFCSGFVSKKLGLGTALLGSTCIASLGVALSTTATGWHTLMSSMLLVGVGAGLLDAGINSYAAASLSGRLVNWLHSTYGLGAMLSPLLITVLYRFGGSWRIAYAILSLGLWVLCFLIFRTRKSWSAPTPGDHAHARLTFANYRETLRKPIVWTSVALFLVGTGMEAVAGQWSYSLLTITRRIGPSEAGICVASFWISLTAGRFAIGAIANRVRSGRLLQLGIALAGAGGILLSLDRGMVTALTALVVLGLGLAPLFPLLVSTTTDRVGVRHAANAVGFQVSGAYLGAALLPTLVGAMGNIYGLNVVGPFLVGAALCLYLLHQIVLFFGRQYASTLKLDSAGPTAVTSQA